MPVHLRSIVLPSDDPAAAAAFWAGVLGREVAVDGLVPGTPTQVGLRFVAADSPRTGAGRVHLHLTSASLADQHATVAAALGRGARHLDVGQGADADDVVLADPGGTALCVIEPGSSFLAGCGPLGEIAGEGSREVGLFWSAALDWPLVWDRDGETAVQAPQGGTKVAWGGPPVPAVDPADPPRYDLVADGPRADEVARLVSLGATVLADGEREAVLADPDGAAFQLVQGWT